ncbi:MAG: hypothetical protein ACLP1E_02055 [Acidimicrobiales bacterium]
MGKIRGAIAELYWLSQADASTRLLDLTNSEFLKILSQEMASALPPGVEIIHLALPDELASRVAAVTTAASEEMGLLAFI